MKLKTTFCFDALTKICIFPLLQSPRFFGQIFSDPKMNNQTFRLILSLPKASKSFIRKFTCDPKQARIGIIGLGNVGKNVSNNLLRNGFNLTGLCDTNPKTLERYPQNITRYDSPRSLTENSDVIVTALQAPPDIKLVMEGDQGILAGIQKGSVWVDHTTTDFEQTLRLAKAVEDKGAEALEVPVTGGMALLEQGLMTCLVGGKKDIFEKCLPILRLSCANVLYMGGMGSATITKVISNMLAGLNTVAMGEALMMAKRAGVDLNAFFDGIRLSSGNSFVWETEAPLVFKGTYDPDFTLKLHCKDLNLGYQIAQKYGAPLKLLGLVEQIYNEARVKYGDEAGSSHPPKLIEDALGESLQTTGWEDWTYTIEVNKGGSVGIVRTTKKTLAESKKN